MILLTISNPWPGRGIILIECDPSRLAQPAREEIASPLRDAILEIDALIIVAQTSKPASEDATVDAACPQADLDLLLARRREVAELAMEISG